LGDVGYVGRWTMEISNFTQSCIWIPVNYRICQIAFFEVGETLKDYNGKYGQDAWTPLDMVPKPGEDWDRQWEF
jgi:dCTP deaminase